MLNKVYIWAGVAVLVGVFAVGRYSAPKPTVKIQTVEKIVTKTVQVKAEQKEVKVNKVVVVYRDRIVHKDGTVETKTKTEEHVGSDTHDNTTASTTTDTKKDVTQSVSITTPRADWHVSVLAGTPVAFPPSLRLGALVERRVLGPFYLGAWGLVDTGFGHPMAGVSIGVVF